MKKVVLVALPLLLSSVTLAHGNDTLTARALISLCEPIPNQSKGDLQKAEDECIAYVHGLTDGLFMMQELANHSMTPCMPKEQAIDVGTARRLFSTYLKAHPQTLDNSAGLVMGIAVTQAYPC